MFVLDYIAQEASRKGLELTGENGGVPPVHVLYKAGHLARLFLCINNEKEMHMKSFKTFVSEINETINVNMSHKDIHKHLKGLGWQHIGGSSHSNYKHDSSSMTIAVPRHKSISPGTVRQIIKKSKHFDLKKAD